MKIETFTAPEHWAPALINDDWSGMTDGGIAACEAWAESLPGPVVGCDFDGPDAPGFTPCHDARQFQPLACAAIAYHVLIEE